MVREKPDLFLTVPNAFDLAAYSHTDLITPPYYIVSTPPPLVTPALSRSSSVSTNASQSESDYEFEDDEEEVSPRRNSAPWTIDQDEALLSVFLSIYVSLIIRLIQHIWMGQHYRQLGLKHQDHHLASLCKFLEEPFVVMVGEVFILYHQHVDDFLNLHEKSTQKIKAREWKFIHLIRP